MIVKRQPYDKPYYPSKETIKFFAWFNAVFKEENKPAQAHYQMVDHINKKEKKKVIEASRGLSKSTIIGVYYLIYCIWRGQKYNHGNVSVIVYIMDSVQKVSAQIQRVLYTIEENPVLLEHIEIKRSTMGNDPTIEFWHKEQKRYIKLVGRGTGQSVRGINFMNKRPDWILFDDVESEETAGTKENREKLKSWFFGNVIPAGIPAKTEYTFIGTPLHEDSLLMNLVNSESWIALQLPIAEKFPAPEHEIISAWSDRFTRRYIIESYQSYKDMGKQLLWLQEHMLEITPSDSLLFNLDNIKRYSTKELTRHLNQMTYYISIDLAVSERDTADYTAISVIGVNANNHWFLVDGFFGRVKPDETIDRLFAFVVKYRPYAVVIEKVGFQMAMKTFINNEMVKRGIFFNIEMVSRPVHKNSKLSVFKAFQPIVELGRFWIPEDSMSAFVEELIKEMSMISNDKILATHDDLIDSIAQLTLIEVIASEPIQQGSIFSDTEEGIIDSYIF